MSRTGPLNAVRALRPGMTLVELMLAVIVLSIIAAVLVPTITTAADSYTSAVTTRSVADDVAFALERAVRLCREAPGGTNPGDAGIASASATSITFTNGAGLRLSGTDLLLQRSATDSAVLCRNVETFSLELLSKDGVTSTLATPTQTQRINVRLKARGLELTCAAFLRATVGGS